MLGYIFGLSLLKNDVKRPLAASTRRAPGRSPLRRAARARVARASDRHRSPLSTLCPRTADAQARGRARAVALRTPPSTRARSRTSPVTLYSEQRRCACTPFPRHMHFGGRMWPLRRPQSHIRHLTPSRRVLGVLLLHRFCGRPERGSGRFSAPSAHGILGGVGAAPTAGSGASRPASATLCRGDPAVRRRTARLPGASVRRDEPPRLPPWLRRRPSRTARRDRSRVRGLTHLSRPRVRLSDPRLPFTRRHHRHGRRRPCGTRGTSRPPWRCWPLPRRRSYPPHRWCTASAAPLGASPVILPPPPPPPPV